MRYEFPIHPRQPYVCPPDAGAAERAAYADGFDMAALEACLKLTPEQRLDRHSVLLAEHEKREEFLAFFRRGWEFIQASSRHSQIVNRPS